MTTISRLYHVSGTLKHEENRGECLMSFVIEIGFIWEGQVNLSGTVLCGVEGIFDDVGARSARIARSEIPLQPG